MELHDQLNGVKDEATFLAFVSALAADRRKKPEAWENDSVETFLEAAVAWAEDTGMGATQGLSEASPWKRAAVFLYCGKIYE